MKTKRMEVPIWMQPYRYHAELAWVSLDVPDVSSSDAPEVMRWSGQDDYRLGGPAREVFSYRSYANQLWMPLRLSGDIVENVLKLGMLQMPVVSNAKRPLSERRVENLDTDHAKGMILASAPDLRDRVIMVDGSPWVRSHGPMLRSLWQDHRSVRPRLVHVVGREDVVDPDRNALIFPAWQRDEVDRVVSASYGRPADIVGNMVEILGDVPTGDTGNDILHLSIERSVWHFLWEARFMGGRQSSYGDRLYGDDVGARTSELVVEAREILGGRWPDIDMSRPPTSHAGLSPHLHGRTVKDASELLPLLEAITDNAKDAMPSHVRRNWGAIVDWAHDRLGPAPANGAMVEDLVGFAR